MKKRVVAIIQARMRSTRLPGKVLREIGGKSLLEILVNRLKNSQILDEIVIATTVNKNDDNIVELSKKMSIGWHRGSEEDVLKRYVETARKFNADTVIRITADNPLTDVKLMEKLVEMHIKSGADYTYCNNAPLGTGSEIVNFSVLEVADKNAIYQPEREHVTLYIKNNPGLFKIKTIDSNIYSIARLTIDTREDLEMMKELYENVGNLDHMDVEKVIHFLEQHPKIHRINAHISQKMPIQSNKNKVRISVIVRTHNSENFVKNTIESALHQTLSKDFYEILVIDDGSTDGTVKLLQSYRKKIRIIEEKRLGSVKAINLGIKNSLGGYVILLDSDDTFEPTILEVLLKTMEENNIDFVYCDYYEKDIESGEVRIVSLKNNLFMSVAGGILFKKYILEEMGGYDENLVFPEYDLLIKLIKKGYKHVYIAKPLYTYVRHKRSLTSNKKLVEKGFKQLFDKYGEIEGLRKY